MKKNFLTTTALLCCFMVCFAIVADLTGKWTGTITTPDGQQLPVTYTFKADGTTLTGTAESPAGVVPIDNGKIDGDKFTFSVNVSGTEYPHTGKIYADSCGMDIDFGGPKAHFIIKRADK
jgi:hypothetical protein